MISWLFHRRQVDLMADMRRALRRKILIPIFLSSDELTTEITATSKSLPMSANGTKHALQCVGRAQDWQTH